MRLAAASRNPTQHKSSTIVKNYLSRRFSNFQLQSRLPGASQHHTCFAARSCANALRFVIAGCKPAKRERCTKSTNVRAASTVRTIQHCSERANFWQFFLFVKSSSRYSLVHILATSSSKSAPNASILLTFWIANRALATVLCAFCRRLCQNEPRTQT